MYEQIYQRTMRTLEAYRASCDKEESAKTEEKTVHTIDFNTPTESIETKIQRMREHILGDI